MTTTVELRPGAYYDSVALMRVSRTVSDAAGVQAALVAMGTPLNVDLLEELGFAPPAGIGPADLVVALRADDDAALDAARELLDAELAALSQQRSAPTAGEAPARSLRTAMTRSGATLALVSVPGPHAFTEAMDAVESGRHVMLFSDNVPVGQEVALKDAAAEHGVLVMGPDCGTAHVAGVGLGFANAVRPGRVGIVAASGTGAQQLMCLLDAAGVGINHVLGVGGRDLSADVGGRSTLRALAALGADPGTDLVVLVSKPPAAEVAARVAEAARGLGKPVVDALLGAGRPDLTAVAEQVLRALGVAVPDWPRLEPADLSPPAAGALRGLFSGGTLCDEAMLIATAALGPVRSNIPLRPDLALPADLTAPGHVFLDLGDDTLTAGRPHPMIDSTLRLERLAREAADAQVSTVLLDVVLGYGANPDPAADLAPALAAARETAERDGRRLGVVVSLCGTAGDPQRFDTQAAALRDAGAWVFLSNAAAARHAVALTGGASHG